MWVRLSTLRRWFYEWSDPAEEPRVPVWDTVTFLRGSVCPCDTVTLLRGPVYPRGTITLLRVSCVSTWDTVTLLRVSCVSMWDTVTLVNVSCVFTWETVTLLRGSVCLHGTFILLRGSVCPHGRQLPCRRGSPYAHMSQFNCDTVASSAWLNLGKEPFPEAARRYLH